MKPADFREILKKTPCFVPIFRIIKIPKWLSQSSYPYTFTDISIGDEFYADGESMSPMKDLKCSNQRWLHRINPSYFEFVEYRNIKA